jgi:hypothetical protein
MSNKELNHNFYGVIFSVSCLVFLLTNMFWGLLPKVPIHDFLHFKIKTTTPIEEQTKIGEWFCYLTLFTAFSCSLTVCKKYFKKESFNFYLAAVFFETLSWAKVFTIFLLNPFEYQASEFWNLGLAIIISIYRLIKKK